MNIWSRSGNKKGKVLGTKKQYCGHCKKIHDFYVVEWEHRVTNNCPNIMVKYGNDLKIV